MGGNFKPNIYFKLWFNLVYDCEFDEKVYLKARHILYSTVSTYFFLMHGIFLMLSHPNKASKRWKYILIKSTIFAAEFLQWALHSGALSTGHEIASAVFVCIVLPDYKMLQLKYGSVLSVELSAFWLPRIYI